LKLGAVFFSSLLSCVGQKEFCRLVAGEVVCVIVCVVVCVVVCTGSVFLQVPMKILYEAPP